MYNRVVCLNSKVWNNCRTKSTSFPIRSSIWTRITLNHQETSISRSLCFIIHSWWSWQSSHNWYCPCCPCAQPVAKFLPQGGYQVAQFGRAYEPIPILVKVSEPFNEVITSVSRPSRADCLHYWQEHLESNPVISSVLNYQLFNVTLSGILKHIF